MSKKEKQKLEKLLKEKGFKTDSLDLEDKQVLEELEKMLTDLEATVSKKEKDSKNKLKETEKKSLEIERFIKANYPKDNKKEDRLTRTEKYEQLSKEIAKDKERISNDKEKRSYNKYNIKRQGGLTKFTKYNNKLLNSQIFNIVPVELNENNGNVKVSTQEGVFSLTNNDIKIDTLISNIVDKYKDELDENGYIERTLLNVVNEFYYPVTSKHWTEKQYREVFDMLIKNMTPLYFRYADGSEALTPLINIRFDKKSADATATIRINANQYIKEYNNKIKGSEVTIYRYNLKALGLPYTAKASELVEKVTNEYILNKVNRFMFSDFKDFYNEDSRTEKARFKKQLKEVLTDLSDYSCYGFSKPREIKKDPKKSNSEVIGLAVTYKKQ